MGMLREDPFSWMSNDELRAIVANNASARVWRCTALDELLRRQPPLEHESVAGWIGLITSPGFWVCLVSLVYLLSVLAVAWFQLPPAHPPVNLPANHALVPPIDPSVLP